MNRTERLLDLITYLLNAPEPVSWQEIKNHFPEDYARGIEESNQRKFERDKAELISLGIPIDYQSGSETKKEGYVIQKERLFLPEIEFTPEESSLLMLSAGAVLENESFPYRDHLESSLHKITSLHRRFDRAPQSISITYSAQERGRAPRSPWINSLQDALDRRKWIEIQYHAFTTGETSRRRVNPYGLIFRRGNWTVIGWDHLRQDIRSFVVSRIQKLKVNQKRPGTPDYEIPPDFSLKEYQNQQAWDFQVHEPLDVTIEVEPHRLPELLPQLQKATDLGRHRFQIHVTNREGLLSWVLANRTDVRLVEPSELRAQLLKRLKALQ